VIAGVAFSYAYFAHLYTPLQAVASFVIDVAWRHRIGTGFCTREVRGRGVGSSPAGSEVVPLRVVQGVIGRGVAVFGRRP